MALLLFERYPTPCPALSLPLPSHPVYRGEVFGLETNILISPPLPWPVSLRVATPPPWPNFRLWPESDKKHRQIVLPPARQRPNLKVCLKILRQWPPRGFLLFGFSF